MGINYKNKLSIRVELGHIKAEQILFVKFTQLKKVSCLLDLVLRLHYTCLVWQLISLH